MYQNCLYIAPVNNFFYMNSVLCILHKIIYKNLSIDIYMTHFILTIIYYTFKFLSNYSGVNPLNLKEEVMSNKLQVISNFAV